MKRRLAGLLLVIAFCVAILAIGERRSPRGSGGADEPARGQLPSQMETGGAGEAVARGVQEEEVGKTDRAAACAACHPDLYEEWASSMHARAWTDPLVRLPRMADDFRRRDCLPCHAPAPILEHAIEGKVQVIAREEDPAAGVDCLACHGVGGQVAARNTRPEASCRPVARSEITTIDICYPCHDQHGTVSKEWLFTDQAADGVSCQVCHMPEVMRPARGSRSARPGRSHRFSCSRDRATLASAIQVQHALSDGEGALPRALRVTITNTGAAHDVPTDARHRALDLVVTLEDASGQALPVLEERGLGEERGTARLRLRNPYRTEYGLEDTRLAAGESRTLDVVVPAEARRAVIAVIYKIMPYLADEEGLLVSCESVELAR